MEVVRRVRFDDDDREVFARALEGHGHALENPPRKNSPGQPDYPVWRHLSRLLVHREDYDGASLRELADTLNRLIEKWSPEATAEAWREKGATGSDEAVQGLADTRQQQIENAFAAIRVVDRALEFSGSRGRRIELDPPIPGRRRTRRAD